MVRIAIKAFYPENGKVRDMAPKTLAEYAEWVTRGAILGYRAYRIDDNTVEFFNTDPDYRVVFSARTIENARCAMDYVNWTVTEEGVNHEEN